MTSGSKQIRASFRVWDNIRNEQLWVYKRPYLNQFLEELIALQDQNIIDIATYTAGTQDYADEVLA